MEFCSANKDHFDQIINMVTSPLDYSQLEVLSNKRLNLTVAMESGEIVAFANLYNVNVQISAFIGNIIVSKGSRGKGIGKGITEHMLDICSNEHNATPHLSVFNNNTRALLMYSKLGFKPYSIEQRFNLQQETVALIHMKLER